MTTECTPENAGQCSPWAPTQENAAQAQSEADRKAVQDTSLGASVVNGAGKALDWLTGRSEASLVSNTIGAVTGPIAVANGVVNVMNGVDKTTEANPLDGAVDIGKGVMGAIGGAGSTVASALGLLGMGVPAGTTAGAAAAGAAGAAGIAATAGAVGGGAALGLGVGTGIAKAGDEWGRNESLFGKNDDGTVRSAMDDQAAGAVKIDNWVKEKTGSETAGTIAGGTAAAFGGIGAGVMGLVGIGANGLEAAGSWLGEKVGGVLPTPSVAHPWF